MFGGHSSPKDLKGAFEAVGRTIAQHRALFAMSVCRTPNAFMMYFDLDLLSTAPWTEEHVRAFCRETGAAVLELYPTGVPPLSIIVCQRQPRVVEVERPEGKVTMYKDGVHIYVTSLTVSLQSGCALTLALQRRLQSAPKGSILRRNIPAGENDWGDAVDVGPILNGGMLRAPYTCKCSPCPECNRIQRAELKETLRVTGSAGGGGGDVAEEQPHHIRVAPMDLHFAVRSQSRESLCGHTDCVLRRRYQYGQQHVYIPTMVLRCHGDKEPTRFPDKLE